MIIIADALLPVIVQQFDAAVHCHRITGEVKSRFCCRKIHFFWNALGCGITNTIDLRHDFYQIPVKFIKMGIPPMRRLTFMGVQKGCHLVAQTLGTADSQPASGYFYSRNPGQGFIQTVILMQPYNHCTDRQITQDVILSRKVEVIYLPAEVPFNMIEITFKGPNGFFYIGRDAFKSAPIELLLPLPGEFQQWMGFLMFSATWTLTAAFQPVEERRLRVLAASFAHEQTISS